MKAEDRQELDSEISRAHAYAAEKKMDLAVRSFDLARAMAHLFADQKTLQTVIDREYTNLSKEREKYSKIISQANTAQSATGLLILGDSLGLPRPDQMKTPHFGAENTYSWLLSQSPHDFAITQKSQRYFTTKDALKTLDSEIDLAKFGAAIIHLGLNDCANRMFLVRERLALSLLDETLRQKIVTFSQKHRLEILKTLPSRHYVTKEKYRRNLEVLIARLKLGGVGKIAIATTILPPSRFWAGTPGVNRNFASYNFEVMDVAKSNDVVLFDFDRLACEKGNGETLNEDGMHLSEKGHQLFASEVAKLLS